MRHAGAGANAEANAGAGANAEANAGSGAGAKAGVVASPGANASAKARARRVAELGAFAAIALILGYVERALPPPVPALPGVKLGLANVAVLVALHTLGARAALAVNVVRVALSGALFVGLWGAAYGMAGALASFLAIWLCWRSGAFGSIGISVAGGACHNAGQLCFAALAARSPALFHYLPPLLVSGVAAGAAVGYISGVVAARAKGVLN